MSTDDLAEILFLRAEVERLRAENRALKERLERPEVLPVTETSIVSPEPVPGHVHESDVAPSVHAGSPPEVKVRLFTQLFRGRDDVYAARWAGKDGRSGYSPSCVHEWDRLYCAKPRIKCAACAHREYRPLTDEVITEHLSGKKTIGVYARRLGFHLVTLTTESHPEPALKSYDRFFPSQDTLPKGGFGNLVALPLQKEPREKGNSVFLAPSGEPWADQWAFLAKVRKMEGAAVEAIVRDALRHDAVVGVRLSLSEEEEGVDPWITPPADSMRRSARKAGP